LQHSLYGSGSPLYFANGMFAGTIYSRELPGGDGKAVLAIRDYSFGFAQAECETFDTLTEAQMWLSAFAPPERMVAAPPPNPEGSLGSALSSLAEARNTTRPPRTKKAAVAT